MQDIQSKELTERLDHACSCTPTGRLAMHYARRHCAPLAARVKVVRHNQRGFVVENGVLVCRAVKPGCDDEGLTLTKCE